MERAPKLDDKTQDNYSQKLDGLSKDLNFAKTMIEEFNDSDQKYQDYYKIYSSDKIEPSEVYEKLSDLKITSTALSFNSSTTESLQNSGDIGLIPSGIRNKLIDLKRSQILLIKRSD